jgi:hypothetical protein
VAAIAVGVSACAGGSHPKNAASSKKRAQPTASATTASPTPAPNYTINQVLHGLISANDVGEGFKATVIGTQAYIDKKALICSLTGASLPNNPQIGERQYAATINVRYDRNYAQFIALYPSAQLAEAAYMALK